MTSVVARPAFDLRLLSAACVAWAVLLAMLGAGWTARPVALAAAASLVLGALCALARHAVLRRGHPPIPAHRESTAGRLPDAGAPARRAARADRRRRPARWGRGLRRPPEPRLPLPVWSVVDRPCAAVRFASGRSLVADVVGKVLRAAGSVAVLAALVTGGVSLSAAGHLAVRDAGPVAQLAADRAVVTVEARVAQDVRILPVTAERPKPKALARVVVRSVSSRGRTSAVRSSVMLIGPPELGELRWRDRIRITGRLGPADPGDRALGWLTASRPAEVLDGPGPVMRLAEHVRDRLRQAVQPLPADARGLVPGLVIGDRSLAPPDLNDAMLATGMSHLTAASGSNVTIVVAAAVLASGAFRVRRRWRPLVGAVAIAGFVVLARPDPSVIRAAVMGVVGLLGMTAARRSVGPAALGAAVVALLLLDPWLARSYGFALSTLATLGLLAFARPWGDRLGARLPARVRPLADATAIALAAQAACAPVVVLLQDSVPIVGVVANLAAAPLVAPATVAGVLAALAAAVWLPAGTALAWVAGLPAWAIAWIAHTLAPLPFGTVLWLPGIPGALLLAAFTVLALVSGPWLLQRGSAAARRHPLRSLALALLLVASLWPMPPPPPPRDWEFVACDVGQGDALLVATTPGRAVLVDAGPEPAAVDRCLHRLRVTGLDAVFLTHFHDDHVAGLPGALAGRRAGALYVSPLPEPRDQADRVGEWADDAGLTPVPVGAGSTLEFTGPRGPVTVRVRAPARITTDGSMPNNNSVVLDVTTPDLRLLLLADIEREEGAALAQNLRADPDPRPVDVVKVAHHGSANLDAGLVRALRAPVAVVSVGAGNDYGHPTDRAVDAYTAAGATILRTDHDGDIVLTGSLPPTPGGRALVQRFRP